MSVSKQVNVNTLSQLVGKSVCLVFGMVTTIVLRRYLGLEGFGNYIFIITFITPFITLSDFGTHLVSVTQASQRKDIQQKVLGNVLLLRPLISFIAIFISVILLVVFFRNRSLYSLLLISLPLVFLITYKNSLMVVLHSKLKLYIASLQDALAAFFLLITAFLLTASQKGLQYYILLMIVSYLATVTIFSFVTFKLVSLDFRPNLRIIKKIFYSSLPLAGILFFYTLYSRVDTFILKFVWGSDVVGIYGLSFRVYENLILPAAFFMNSILPLLARQVVVADKKKLFLLLQRAADLLISFSLIGTLSIFVSAPFIIRIFTGSFSWPEITSLRILVFALPFAFLNHFAGYTIIAIGQQKKALHISFFALLLNLVLNLIFIPRFSFIAAAVILILTQVFVFFLSLRIIKKTTFFRLNFFSWPNTTLQFIKLKGRIFDE